MSCRVLSIGEGTRGNAGAGRGTKCDFVTFWGTAGDPGTLRRKAENGTRGWESIIGARPVVLMLWPTGLSGLQDSSLIICATLPVFRLFTAERTGD